MSTFLLYAVLSSEILRPLCDNTLDLTLVLDLLLQIKNASTTDKCRSGINLLCQFKTFLTRIFFFSPGPNTRSAVG